MAAVLQSRDAGATQARRILRSQPGKGMRKLDREPHRPTAARFGRTLGV